MSVKQLYTILLFYSEQNTLKTNCFASEQQVVELSANTRLIPNPFCRSMGHKLPILKSLWRTGPRQYLKTIRKGEGNFPRVACVPIDKVRAVHRRLALQSVKLICL